jgi:Tol biopolymer transport system component
LTRHVAAWSLAIAVVVCAQAATARPPLGRALAAAPQPPYDMDPEWSPDGSRIAFYRDSAGAMVADARGRHLHALGGESWSWSPNGRAIAFSRVGAITVAEPDGGDARALTVPPPAFVDTAPAWSLDGRTIAFERRPVSPGGYEPGSIWLVPAAGGLARRLDSRTEPEWSATWSPDSTHIAFSSCSGGGCHYRGDGDLMRSDLFVERPNGRGRVRLTHTDDNDGARWSPAGSLIAFERAHDLDLSSTVDIFLVRPDGSGLRNLTEPGVTRLKDTGPPEVSGFSWSPHGRFLVYSSDRGEWPFPHRLWIVRRDGRRNRLLTNPPISDESDEAAYEDADPDWSPYGRYVAFTREHTVPGTPEGSIYGSIRTIRVRDRKITRITP